MGLGAGLGLVLFYVGVLGLVQGWEHARSLLWQDRYFVLAIASGFGAQWGLFSHLRRLLRHRPGGGATPAAAAGTGTSTVSMVACCLHHLTDVLPVIGLSGAAIFLASYRTPLMALAVAMNLLGIGLMLRLWRKHRSASCHQARS